MDVFRHREETKLTGFFVGDGLNMNVWNYDVILVCQRWSGHRCQTDDQPYLFTDRSESRTKLAGFPYVD